MGFFSLLSPILTASPICFSLLQKSVRERDEGAWCLSSSECDHLASPNPNESKSEEDKHQAPTLPLIRPLSLQDGDRRIPGFGRSKPSGRGRTLPSSGSNH